MSEILSAARPDFFGKDSFCPFFGEVEDVMDPNRSGRVKVRILGVHTENKEGEDSIKTEDLPWARVGMPTTHANQARIGGKHGLQPGCWVMGFFLDGDESQDPFVLCTFNQTAKTSSKDNRQDVDDGKGRIKKTAKGFVKVASAELLRNVARLTKEEQSKGGYGAAADKAGDTTLTDETDNNCGNLKPVSSERRMEEPFKKGGINQNAESDNIAITTADGRCGSAKHAQNDIQKYIQELMPSMQSRFVYGDMVWERVSGNAINLQAGQMNLAQLICAIMKLLLNLVKQQQEDKINRTLRTATLKVTFDRDGATRIKVDQALTVRDDLWSAALALFLQLLCQLIQSDLNDLNNGGEDGGSDDNGTTIPNPITVIDDNTAACLSEKLMKSIECQFIQHIEDSNIAIEETIKSIEESEGGMDGFLDGIGGAAGIIGAIMGFLTADKFTQYRQLFHAAGDQILDPRQKQCQNVRQYQTNLGYLLGMGFGSGGGGGGGDDSDDDDSSDDTDTNPDEPGFGGLSPNLECGDLVPCEEATKPKDPGDDDDPDDDDEPDEEDIDRHPDRSSRIMDINIVGPRLVYTNKRYKYDCDATLKDSTPKIRRASTYKWTSFGTKISNRDNAKITAKEESRNDMGEQVKIKFLQPGRYRIKVRVRNKFAKNSPKFKKITVKAINEDGGGGFVPATPPIEFNPDPPGGGGTVIPLPLPTDDPIIAPNPIVGLPTVPVITDPGRDYITPNPRNPDNKYPVIEIPEYTDTPIPVVDPDTGELVVIVAPPSGYGPVPNPAVTIIPGTSPVGIDSDNPEYDIEIGGVYIQNTGRGYCLPTITFIDKDTGLENGKAELVVLDGRIVDVVVTDTGTGFKRIPEVQVEVMGKFNLLNDLEEEITLRGLSPRIISKGDKPK